MEKIKLVLKRPAKKSGGDRYETLENYDNDQPFVVYFPQKISRKEGRAREILEVTIE